MWRDEIVLKSRVEIPKRKTVVVSSLMKNIKNQEEKFAVHRHTF